LQIDPNIEKSIAILPFKNLSPEEENQYFCDGVMEGILNNLSQIKDLRVLSRSSTDKYREKTPPSPQIAEELNVNYLVEASVFKSEDKIRVTAQLIDARNDEHIWSNQYDRAVNDIFNVMTDISKEVASEIEVVIAPEVIERIESIPTENQEAYELYLRGREYHLIYQHRRVGGIDKSILSTAIHFYEQAIEIDPRFALAYNWLGWAYENQIEGSDYLKESYMDTLKFFVEKALSIDPNLAEGYASLSDYYRNNGEIDKAIKYGKKAIELKTNYSEAYWTLAKSYKAKNDYINAIINFVKVKKLVIGTQDYENLLWNLGNAYQDISDYERAEITYLELVEYNPIFGYNWLRSLSENYGEWDKMKYYTDQICEIDSGFACMLGLSRWFILIDEFTSSLKYFEEFDERRTLRMTYFYESVLHGYALYKLGRKMEAMELFNQQIKISNESIRLNRDLATGATGGAAYYAMAGCYAIMEENEKVYDVLYDMEKNSFSGWYTTKIQYDPLFKGLRDDDEFKAIIQRQEKIFADIRAEIDRLEAAGEL
jgi:TolB-like protein